LLHLHHLDDAQGDRGLFLQNPIPYASRLGALKFSFFTYMCAIRFQSI
jgi:hypothetical protein